VAATTLRGRAALHRRQPSRAISIQQRVAREELEAQTRRVLIQREAEIVPAMWREAERKLVVVESGSAEAEGAPDLAREHHRGEVPPLPEGM